MNTPEFELTVSLLPLAAAMEDPMNDFDTMLLYYTQRSLTNPNDILRALAGMIRRLGEKAASAFFQGLPAASFDAFVIFTNYRGYILRRRPGFPSYSWTGWFGGVLIGKDGTNGHRDDMNGWLAENTWIVWYQRSPSGVLNLIWDPDANDSFPFHDVEYIGYRSRQPFRPPEGLLEGLSTPRTYPTKDLPHELPSPGYPLLQFWTLSVYFKLGPFDAWEGYAHTIDRYGTVAGEVYLDGLDDPNRALLDSSEPREFIVLSEARFDNTRSPERALESYHVLLLEWDGHVAERRGKGLIYKTAIDSGFAPGPEWKEILLG